MNPAALNETAPDTFQARFETSAGDFVIEVMREWAPNGADRFYNLVKNGYYDDCRFFRVIDGFMVQFGINGDPAIQNNWRNAGIPDDPVEESNERGYVTFAMSSLPNSRTTQIFINFGNNLAQLSVSISTLPDPAGEQSRAGSATTGRHATTAAGRAAVARRDGCPLTIASAAPAVASVPHRCSMNRRPSAGIP